MAGLVAAISAAREGARVVLMHERPVPGGNASGEIRMWVCGSKLMLETGLIEELRLENRYRNNTSNYSIWDSITYEMVAMQENLTVLFNCSCQDAAMDGSKIVSVTGYQQTTQEFHEVRAQFFADCSGDSILAPLTGAEIRTGREAKSEFGESLAQDTPDNHTMGMSCLLQAREMPTPQKFIPPAWAYSYPTEESLPPRGHKMGRFQNFWWVELGGMDDSIADTEKLRDELRKTLRHEFRHHLEALSGEKKLEEEDSTDVFIGGSSKLLNYPEYSDVQKAKNFVLRLKLTFRLCLMLLMQVQLTLQQKKTSLKSLQIPMIFLQFMMYLIKKAIHLPKQKFSMFPRQLLHLLMKRTFLT